MITSLNQSQKQELLASCYSQGNKIIQFIKNVRGENNDYPGKYSVKRADLNSIFRNTLWENQQKQGHQKWKHPVTGVIVEYVDRGNNIDPGAVVEILNQLQEHLNFFRNNIFNQPWKYEPNYSESVKRLGN